MGLKHPGYEEREGGLTTVDAARPSKDCILNRSHVIPVASAGDLKYAIPFLVVIGRRTDINRSFRTRRGLN